MTGTGSVAFGQWLRERIGTRTYGQVGEYVGVRASTVSRWVTGESAPEYRNRLALATYLQVDPAEVHAFFPHGKPAPDLSGHVLHTGRNETGTVASEDEAALAATADALFFGLVGDLTTLPVRTRVNVLAALHEIVRRDVRGERGAGDRSGASGAG